MRQEWLYALGVANSVCKRHACPGSTPGGEVFNAGFEIDPTLSQLTFDLYFVTVAGQSLRQLIFADGPRGGGSQRIEQNIVGALCSEFCEVIL